MTCLIRCRGSASEIARLFDADPDSGLDWRESIWTGEPVPVVVRENGARRLRMMTWGLSAPAFAKPVHPRQRGTFYARDLQPGRGRLRDPAALGRCLILLESFAYPAGSAGRWTREWTGLSDHPLTAWAGICTKDGCAGLLDLANLTVFDVSSIMPRLLAPDDHARWLAGHAIPGLGLPYPDAAFYCENLAEHWSTGRPQEEALPLFAAMADRRSGQGGR
jgi:putative SOS response-associated peptidase YedK